MKVRKFLAHGTAVLGIAVLIAFLAGCATTVPIKSVRQPTIKTSGIQRLAIKPFEDKSGVGGQLAAQIMNYLNDKTSQVITSEGHEFYTIVSATDPNAEGIFTGEIRRITSSDKYEDRKSTDKDGNEIIVRWYLRNVALEFQYSVIDSRTNMSRGSVTKQGSQSDSSTDPSRLASTEAMARRIIDSQLRSFKSDILPTTVSSNVKLMDEKSKDKILKERFKTAMALVKNNTDGTYQSAIELFDELAKDYNSAAARENARILRQAVESDIAAQAEMAAIKSDTGGLVEKAVEGVVSLLGSTLPPNSNIILMKTNSTEQTLLDNAIDQISKSITQSGRMKIVDRQNQELMNRELDYQLSGNVSDDSYVSIGRQYGAQYIVLCWVSGEMSARKLNVKVLNIETSHVEKQSDFEI